MIGKYTKIYLAIALLTFGYIASGTQCEPSNFTGKDRTDCVVMKGATGGALWPLYWTWEVFSLGRNIIGNR